VRAPSFHGKPKAMADFSESEQAKRVSLETMGKTLYDRDYEAAASEPVGLRSGGYRSSPPLLHRGIPHPVLASFHEKLALVPALHDLPASSLGGFHGKLDTVELGVRLCGVRESACHFATTDQASMRAKRCSESQSTSSVTAYADTAFQ
jgi:hypothetical protein